MRIQGAGRTPAACRQAHKSGWASPAVQVTKAPRAAAALMLAPLVERLMEWMQHVLGLKTRRAVRGLWRALAAAPQGVA